MLTGAFYVYMTNIDLNTIGMNNFLSCYLKEYVFVFATHSHIHLNINNIMTFYSVQSNTNVSKPTQFFCAHEEGTIFSYKCTILHKYI